MKTQSIKQNAGVEIIEKQIAVLQNRKALMEKLLQQKQEIDNRMTRLLSGEDIQVTTTTPPSATQKQARKPRQMIFPRGVLTAATFNAINQRVMSIDEIVEAVKVSPILQGNVPKDLDKRVKALLVASDQFRSLGNNMFTTAKPKLEGKLFQRLSVVAA